MNRRQFTAVASSPVDEPVHTQGHNGEFKEVELSANGSALVQPANGNGGANGGGIEMKPLRLPLTPQSPSQSPPAIATAAPVPQSLPEALDALAAARAEIATLQLRLASAGQSSGVATAASSANTADGASAFTNKGMDHSSQSHGGRLRLDIEPSESAVRDGGDGALEADALNPNPTDLESGETEGGVSRRPPFSCCGLIQTHPDADGGGPTMSLAQYFATPFYFLLLKRLPWLLGLLLLQSFSASILHRYDAYLSTHAVFTFFVPMIVGTGGNAGNQCSVMVTRALALGMADSEVMRVVKKETPTAIATGIILGVAAFLRVVLEYPGDGMEAAAIGVTLGVSIVISIALGIAFSYGIGLLNRCDPADGAAPLLTTISDLIGIALLCGIATSMVP